MSYLTEIEKVIKKVIAEVKRNPFSYWSEEDVRFLFKQELEKKLGKPAERKVIVQDNTKGENYGPYKKEGLNKKIGLLHSEIGVYDRNGDKIGMLDLVIMKNDRNKSLYINGHNGLEDNSKKLGRANCKGLLCAAIEFKRHLNKASSEFLKNVTKDLKNLIKTRDESKDFLDDSHFFSITFDYSGLYKTKEELTIALNGRKKGIVQELNTKKGKVHVYYINIAAGDEIRI